MESSEAMWQNAQEHLRQRTQGLRRLLAQPVHRLNTLSETEVPESMGVYILYDHGAPTYVGKAVKADSKGTGKPSGLRFRIMHNHLGRAGSDNFLRYLGEELGVEAKQAAQYVKLNYGCQWMELGAPREALLLEHFAIAVLSPRLNRA